MACERKSGFAVMRHGKCKNPAAMKIKLHSILGISSCVILPFMLASCDVDKVEEGSVPEVKVEVKGDAKLPKYEVDGPDVTVGKKTVEIPTIDVDIPEEEDNEPNKKDNE